eukprot:244555_1
MRYTNSFLRKCVLLLIHISMVTIWISWNWCNDNDLYLTMTTESHHYNPTQQCNINLNNITKFGSFYGISYYVQKGNLPYSNKSSSILSIATMSTIDRLSS